MVRSTAINAGSTWKRTTMETVTLEATKHYYNLRMVVNPKFEIVKHPGVDGGRFRPDNPADACVGVSGCGT
jgi:hypothetical protein